MHSETAINRFYKFALHDDSEFLTLATDHQEMIKFIMLDKLGNPLVREKIVCKVLGVTHNPNMFSTYNGSTTFDGTHPETQKHYEVKTEQFNTNNNGRKNGDNGQLSGAGVFGGMKDDISMIHTLIKNNPIIAHGMFADGRLLAVCTFQLSDAPEAINRMLDYATKDSKTAVRYLYGDWANIDNMTVEYMSTNWPDHVAPKYRAHFANRVQIQENKQINKALKEWKILKKTNDNQHILSNLIRMIGDKTITIPGFMHLVTTRKIILPPTFLQELSSPA